MRKIVTDFALDRGLPSEAFSGVFLRFVIGLPARGYVGVFANGYMIGYQSFMRSYWEPDGYGRRPYALQYEHERQYHRHTCQSCRKMPLVSIVPRQILRLGRNRAHARSLTLLVAGITFEFRIGTVKTLYVIDARYRACNDDQSLEVSSLFKNCSPIARLIRCKNTF